MKDEPSLDAKCKDKFLVQTVAVTGDMEFANVTSIVRSVIHHWEHTTLSNVCIVREVSQVGGPRAQDPGELVASGLEFSRRGCEWHCMSPIFMLGLHICLHMDTGLMILQNGVDDEPPAYTSPSANYETPAIGTSKKSAQETSPIPPPDFNEKPKRQELSPQSNDFTAAKSNLNESSNVNELRTLLSEANSQIQRLKDKVSENGLRQRKIGINAQEPSAPALQQQRSQPSVPGVPIQIVAGLCLLSFLIAYFFF